MRLLKYIVLAFLSLSGSFAQAGFIASGNQVSTLSLKQDAVSFYDYTNGSANTGFEESNSLLFFITEFAGSHHLVGLFDSPVESQDMGGVDLLMEDKSFNLGGFDFIDDQGPNGDYFWQNTLGTLSVFKSGWAKGYSDGFVYNIGGTLGTDITLKLSKLRGIDAINFLNFDGQGNIISRESLDTTFDIKYIVDTNSNRDQLVSTPSHLFSFSLALLVLTLVRRNAKN
jgi:hypothetical protein